MPTLPQTAYIWLCLFTSQCVDWSGLWEGESFGTPQIKMPSRPEGKSGTVRELPITALVEKTEISIVSPFFPDHPISEFTSIVVERLLLCASVAFSPFLFCGRWAKNKTAIAKCSFEWLLWRYCLFSAFVELPHAAIEENWGQHISTAHKGNFVEWGESRTSEHDVGGENQVFLKRNNTANWE